MFVVTRIVNGLALSALFASALLVEGLELIIVLSTVSALYLYFFDLIFRKKNTKGDLYFAAVWTLLFGYCTFEACISLLNIHETISDPSYIYVTFILIYLAPFLLNGMYLLWRFTQRR